MASPTSKIDNTSEWSGRVVAHIDFSASLAARREELGMPLIPRNAGNRRTPSKQALLEALKQLDANW